MTSAAIKLGPFELQTLIGRGGMAEVWRGVHRREQVPVAVKVITASRAREPKFLAAFKNEVQAVARLHHPGVVVVLDHGLVSKASARGSGGELAAGAPYLAMELASWGSLDRVRTPLAFEDLSRILLSLLDALAHAHARGVIHRDLKPGNVLLAAPTDVRPGLKLTDFGIAHALEADVVGADSASSGTPHFMAPEQFMGQWRDYGPWTDLYAVGCLAHVLATGALPFSGDSAVQLAYAHMNLAPPPLDSALMPKELSGWVQRLMQKHPKDRFRRAADAAWALMRISERWRRRDLPDTGRFIPSEPTSPFAAPQLGGSAGEVRLEEIVPGPLDVAPTALEQLPLEQARGRGTEVADGPPEASPSIRSTVPARASGDGQVDTGDLATLVHGTGFRGTLPWIGEEILSQQSLDGKKLDLPKAELTLRRAPPLPRSWRRQEDKAGSIQLVGAGLGLYGLRQIPMVDRDEERDEIWRALRDVRETRTPRALVIVGAAGVGKSRLVEWMTERADEVGSAVVLKAVHSPVPGPSDGLGRMIARTYRCVEMSRREVLERAEIILTREGIDDPYEWQALTELMHPALHGEIGAVKFGSVTERHVLLIRTLERLCSNRPVLVWLDDVQWGSDAIYFARRLLRTSTRPILLLLTAREESLRDRVVENRALSELLGEVGARKLDVPPLSWTDQKRLVNELLVLDEELSGEVADRTDGNPLFAVQLVGDWVHRGVLRVGEGGFVLEPSEKAELPDDIHQLWARRIKRVIANLTEDAEAALELAAVLGTSVDSVEWSFACDEGDILLESELLDVLVAHRLAQPAEGGWTFAHGMLRESLVRGAKERGRYREHHRTCARMLQRRYGADARGVPARLGTHFVEAGDLEDALEPLLLGAMERLELSQFSEAIAAVTRREEVLSMLDAPPEDERWGEDWVLLARVAHLRGHFDEARELAEKAEGAARRWGARAVLPEALEVMANVAHESGDQAQAIEAFEMAKDLYLWNEDPQGVSNCLFGLGESVYKLGELDAAEAHYDEGLRISEENEDIPGMANHLFGKGFVALWRGDLSGALSLFRQQLQLLENLGNRFKIARCVSALGEVARQSGNLDQAESHYRRALTIDEAIGSSRAWLDRLNVALVLLARGAYDEAQEMIEFVSEQLGDAAEPAQRCLILIELLPCLTERREWEAWDESFLEATALLRETRLKDGDVAWLLELAGDRAKSASDPVRARHCYELAIQQWRALGRPDKAEVVEEAIDLLRTSR